MPSDLVNSYNYLFILIIVRNKLQEKVVLVLVPGGIFLMEGVDFWPHPIIPISLSPPPPLELLVFHEVFFPMSRNASWREALSSDTKSLLHVRLFLCTHCRVACLAVLKGVGDSRESIVCEILHCTYQDPLPTPPPPPRNARVLNCSSV